MLGIDMPLQMVPPLEPLLLVRTPEGEAVELLAGVVVVRRLVPTQVLRVEEGFVAYVAFVRPLAVVALVVSQIVVCVESLLAFFAAEGGWLVTHLGGRAAGAARGGRGCGGANGGGGLLRGEGYL